MRWQNSLPLVNHMTPAAVTNPILGNSNIERRVHYDPKLPRSPFPGVGQGGVAEGVALQALRAR